METYVEIESDLIGCLLSLVYAHRSAAARRGFINAALMYTHRCAAARRGFIHAIVRTLSADRLSQRINPLSGPRKPQCEQEAGNQSECSAIF